MSRLREPNLLQFSFPPFQEEDLTLFKVIQVSPKYQDQQNQRYFYRCKFMVQHHISTAMELHNVIEEEC